MLPIVSASDVMLWKPKGWTCNPLLIQFPNSG